MSEYFRSVSKSGLFSGVSIFKDVKDLYATKIPNSHAFYLTDSPKNNDSKKLFWNGKEVNIPQEFLITKGIGAKIMVEAYEDNVWIIRLATDEEQKIYKRKRSPTNGYKRYLHFSKEIKRHLHIEHNSKYCLQNIVINDPTEGSYIVVRAVKGSAKDYVSGSYKDNCYTFYRDIVVKHSYTGYYLPIGFNKNTNCKEIKDDFNLPVYIRKDGAVIIENHPGVCIKCGASISRYKAPITNICRSCSKSKPLPIIKIDNIIKKIDDQINNH